MTHTPQTVGVRRFSVNLPPDTYDRLTDLAGREKRHRSNMALLLIERGLDVAERVESARAQEVADAAGRAA